MSFGQAARCLRQFNRESHLGATSPATAGTVAEKLGESGPPSGTPFRPSPLWKLKTPPQGGQARHGCFCIPLGGSSAHPELLAGSFAGLCPRPSWSQEKSLIHTTASLSLGTARAFSSSFWEKKGVFRTRVGRPTSTASEPAPAPPCLSPLTQALTETVCSDSGARRRLLTQALPAQHR